MSKKIVDDIKYKNLCRRWRIINGRKLLEMDIPGVEFIVEKILPLFGIIMICGDPGCGKSWFALELAKCLSTGTPLFGRFNVKASKILYLDEESGIAEIKRRLEALGIDSFDAVDFMSFQGFKIDDPEARKELLFLVEHKEYNLVIFDSLRDIHTKNENDSKEMQEIIDCFREFVRKGVTVLVLHHNRKEDNSQRKDPLQILRGSSAILAGLDCLISISSKKINEQIIEYTIRQARLRQGKPAPTFNARLKESGQKMDFEFLSEATEEKITKSDESEEAILRLLDEREHYFGEIVRILSTSCSEQTVRRTIEKLETAHAVGSRKGEGNKTYYFLADTE